jgi:hypothetical protein
MNAPYPMITLLRTKTWMLSAISRIVFLMMILGSMSLKAQTTGCSGIPAAASALASDTTICANSSLTLSLGTTYNYTGMSYQWQSSIDSITWTSIAGATTPIVNTTQNQGTYYQCIVTCTNSGQSVNSSAVFVSLTNYLSCYCSVSNTYGCVGEYIDNVSLGTISNLSSGCIGSYTDYSSIMQTTLVIDHSYNLSVSTYGSDEHLSVWIDFDHSGSFDANELIYIYSTAGIPAVHNINITIPTNAQLGLTKMRLRSNHYLPMNSPCQTAYFGEIEDYMINIVPIPTDDAGVATINTPDFPACELDSNICVSIQNFGTDTLFSCDVSYAVNNGPFTTYNWTGMIPPQSDDTMCTQIGVFPFSIGDDLVVVANNPNGTAGAYIANDSIEILNMDVSMYGTYGIPSDYPTISAAINALNTYGVCDDVVFKLATGTYTEQLSLGPVLGMDSNATVTWTSATGSLTDVTVQFVNNIDSNYVVSLNEASWFRFKNITFKSAGSGLGRVFEIKNESHNNILDSLRVVGLNTFSTSDNLSLIYSDLSSDHENWFMNSSFEKGSYGINIQGAYNSFESGIRIINNDFIDNYYNSISAWKMSGIEIIGNTIHSISTYTAGIGIYCYDCDDGFDISYNHIYTEGNDAWPHTGIYTRLCEGSSLGVGYLTNNILTLGPADGSSTNTFCGLYQLYTDICYVSNNTVTLQSGGLNSMAYRPAYGEYFFTNNNLFTNFGSGYAAYYQFGIPLDVTNNAYFSNGTNKLYFNGQLYSTLLSFQNGSNLDTNSFYVNPNFSDTVAGIPCNDTLDNAGLSLPFVMDDFTHATRQASPDIGAREFIGLGSFSLSNDTICDASYEVISPEVNTVWSVDSATSTGASVVLNASTFPVTFNITANVNSACSVDSNGNQIPFIANGLIRLVPDAKLDSVIHFCADDVRELAPGGGVGASYVWFPTNSTSATIMANSVGFYAVTKLEDGCESAASTVVTLSEGVELLDADICPEFLPYIVDAAISGGTSYSWSDGTNTSENQLSSTGMYVVTASDSFFCASIDSIYFEAIDIPMASISYTSSASAYFFNGTASANAGSSASYVWDFGDGSPVSNDANPTHTFPWSSPSSLASYMVSMIVANDCGSDSTVLEVTPNIWGTNESKEAPAYRVYPNPTDGLLNIEFEANDAEQVSLKVYNLTGQVVSTSSVNFKSIQIIDLSALASGTYILEVTLDGVVSQSRVLVH